MSETIKTLKLEYTITQDSLELLTSCTITDKENNYLSNGIGSSPLKATVDALRSLADRLDVK